MLYGQLPEVSIGEQKFHGILVNVPNPKKSAVLRLPTSEEILERLAQQKSIRRPIGRRKSQTEYTPNPKADLDLFQKIRLDKGEEFDEYEAGNAISKLTYCEVTDCQREAEEYRVSLKTPFGITSHVLAIPTVRDISLYRRGIVHSIDLPHGAEEVRFRIEPAVTLYDAVIQKTEGYIEGTTAKQVPPHHKSAVVSELVQAVDDLDPPLDPNS